MSEREQYGKLADELEDRADTLADENQRLGDRITAVREEAERTRAESPGTPDWDDPDDDDEDDDDDDDDEAPKKDDEDAGRRRRRLTGVVPVHGPVPDDDCPHRVVDRRAVVIGGPRGDDEARDGALAALVVAVEQIDLDRAAVVQ